MRDFISKIPKKRLILFGCAAALVVLNLIVFSLGWFTFNKDSQADGVGMWAVDCPFELKVVGDITSDEKLSALEYTDGVSLGENAFKTGGDDNETQIKWRMSASFDPPDGLEPGKSGRLNFYIIPNVSGDLNVTIDISAIPIDEELNTMSSTGEPDEAAACGFLSGHLLFFRNMDTESGMYSGLINGQFEFPITGAQAGSEVPCSIYWIWPGTLGQLIMPENENLNGNVKPLYGDSSRERSDLLEKMSVEDNMYMYFDKKKSDVSEYLNMIGSSSLTYGSDEYRRLSSAYNEADQKIGEMIPYILFRLTASSN